RLARAYRTGELGLPIDDERTAYWQRLADQFSGSLEPLDMREAGARH
ncbi:sel1 repeat family protein, partial [Halomonas elongata]|nr:sel1 repeat family protein [Halomonas elongata]